MYLTPFRQKLYLLHNILRKNDIHFFVAFFPEPQSRVMRGTPKTTVGSDGSFCGTSQCPHLWERIPPPPKKNKKITNYSNTNASFVIEFVLLNLHIQSIWHLQLLLLPPNSICVLTICMKPPHCRYRKCQNANQCSKWGSASSVATTDDTHQDRIARYCGSASPIDFAALYCLQRTLCCC